VKALRVAGWSRFEKSDHKKCKNMTWVATPTSHDGIGFLRLLTSPEGLRRYGGWHLILQVAAKCPSHGLLVSDSGRPLGAAEIALKTRANESDISDAITACLEIGWLEWVEVDGKVPEVSGGFPEGSRLQDRTGQDKTGEDSDSGSSGNATPPGCALLISSLKAIKAATDAKALDEWITWLNNDVGAETDAENSEVIRWAGREAKDRGVEVRYARHLAKPDWTKACSTHLKDWRRLKGAV
jgi:hypothetical protein